MSDFVIVAVWVLFALATYGLLALFHSFVKKTEA